ncbi:hypothetical protein OPT61_g9872 [Boeremia exigua]|uniref:Uncharacterized protein n=1 Tax=Boeremia exigua TaxID=749465 RepID=A0ACC2HSG2_9PLEO|nr:hypothetical protein OPT61_g9872 [Boeremia exigua]
MFVKEILEHDAIYDHVDQRYIYGELRLNRLNAIYRLTGRAIFRGYQSGYSQYSSFFQDDFTWLASVLAYIVVVLAAMQVGLGTKALGDDEAFQATSYGFTVFAMVASLASVATVVAVFLCLFTYNLIQTMSNASGLKFWSGATSDAPHDVDIVAVQGLGAHSFYTWVKKVPAAETTARIKERTRVKTFSRLFGKKDKALTDDGGTTEAARLDRPQPWGACHPAGQALALAVHGPRYADFRLSVAGMVFLGTPFQGSGEAAYAQWLAKLIRLQKAEGHRYTLLETLQKDSPALYALSIDFWRSYIKYDMVFFYENRKAEYGPVKRQFVSTQSAAVIAQKMVYMDTDHSGLNKFSGADDRNFMLLLPELRKMVENSRSVVAEQFPSKGERLDSYYDYCDQRLTVLLADAGSTGNVHWLVPRTVNSLFTGRSEVVERIQSALCNSGADATKQTRVVITGLGGMERLSVSREDARVGRRERGRGAQNPREHQEALDAGPGQR